MRKFRTVLLAAAAAPVFAVAAHAASGTWQNPANDANFNTNANWSGGSPPGSGQTGTFGVSDIVVINFTADQTVGALVFNNGSSNYTFGFNPNVDLTFNGAGVTRNTGAGTVHFNLNQVDSDIFFINSAIASAGSLPVTYSASNGGQIQFQANSLGGNAILQAGANGEIYFSGSSNAQSAAITVQNAANARLDVYNSASLSSATVVNNNFMNIYDNASAGSATITNNSSLTIYGNATAATSTITTNGGGTTFFDDGANGSTSLQILNGNGILNISGLAGAGTTFGSVESSSNTSSFVLGAKNATVGGNNFSFAPLVNGERQVTFAGVISGAGGSITKAGTGTWILSNANTYDGGTVINGGVLQISADNNLGAAASPVTFTGGTLRVTSNVNTARNMTATSAARIDVRDFGENYNVSGVISGAGGLIKTGAGQLILTGTNTYTNNTQVQGGSLQMGNNGVVGSILGNVSVSSGAQFVINRSDAVTFSGNITGAGSFGNNGTGNVTLSGNNTYSGNTYISNSGNIIATGNSIGNSSDVLFNGSGALVLNANEAVGTINGSGGPINLNNNFLTLSGGSVDPASYGGVISGNGGVTKDGFYTQNLDGVNTYLGDTLVQQGRLNINGSVVNDVYVLFGATLGGSGTIGRDVFVDVGGTLAGTVTIDGNLQVDSGNISPGNSPGAIVVAGDYTPVGTPTYTVDILANQQDAPVNATTHDFFVVGGSVIGAVNTQLLLNPTGTPVPTTGNGLEIARIGNASDGDFFLSTATQTAQNGFYDGFQYLVNFQNNTGPGGSDQFFLRTALREELVANATILAAGRQLTRDCFRGQEHTQNGDGKGNGRVWANGRYGSFEADASTGADFDSDYFCVTGGIDFAVGEGFSVGLRGGYGNQEVDLNVVQGLALLDGDTFGFEAAVTYTSGRGYYSGLTVGYQSTDWDYDHALASGGITSATVDGMIGSLYAGYRYDLGGASTLGFEGAVLFDSTDCDANCFLTGTIEDTSDWEGRLAARYDATWGAIKPYAILSITHNFDDGQRVFFGNAISEVETASALLGVNLGLQADLGQGWALTAEAATTQGLDSEVEGYQGTLGLRKTW